MKLFKSFKNKTYFNITLLLTTLIALPGSGCEPFNKLCKLFKCCEKPKETIEHEKENKQTEKEKEPEKEDKSQALITVGNKTIFTKNDLENFCQETSEVEPQFEMLLQYSPHLKCQLLLQHVVPLEIAKIWAEKEGKMDDPKLQHRINQECKNVKSRLVYAKFQEEALNNIDKSDSALKSFYDKNKDTMPIFQRSAFLKTPALTSALLVEFDKEGDANKFEAKAKAPNTDFKALATQDKKRVKELKDISSETKDLDPTVISKLETTKVGQVVKTTSGKDKYSVIKVTDKKEAKHLNYEEIKENPQLKNAVESLMLQTLGSEIVNNKIEEIKKKYDIKINSADLEKEVEEKMKELQAAIEKEKEENSDLEDLESGTEQEKLAKSEEPKEQV